MGRLTIGLCLGLALNLGVVFTSQQWFLLPRGAEMYCDTYVNDTIFAIWTGILIGLPCCLAELVFYGYHRRGGRVLASGIGLLLNLLPIFLAHWLNDLAISVRHLQVIA